MPHLSKSRDFLSNSCPNTPAMMQYLIHGLAAQVGLSHLAPFKAWKISSNFLQFPHNSTGNYLQDLFSFVVLSSISCHSKV